MTTKPLRIAFMGTPDFAVQALDALHKAGHEIAAVYSQPPRPAGRGHKLQPSPVQTRAEELGIPAHNPRSLKKNAAARAAFRELNLDIAVVAAYGLLLPKEVLEAPRFGCLNIHASLLPRWRGASPIQRAILAGDPASGVCIMQMDEGLDTGPVLMRGEVPLNATSTASSLHDALAAQGADLIVKTLQAFAEGNPPKPETQSQEGVTYAALLTKDDGRIDWTQPASAIERQLRALNPWPGVWCLLQGQRLKVLEAELAPHNKGRPGEILDRRLIVGCGEGALLLKKIQPQDRKAMDGLSFMNGTHLNIGDILS